MQISAYIDGYNLYHAVDDLCIQRNIEGQIIARYDKHFLKWLDIRKLVLRYIKPDQGQELVDIYYFSAFATHISESKVKRHKSYIAALKQRNIHFIEGQFKYVGMKWVKREDGTFILRESYEEKESDVNLAIAIVRDAILKIVDKAIIITNDSDIAPAIRMAKQLNPLWKATVITPPLGVGRTVNHGLLEAAQQLKTNRSGQVFRESKILSEATLMECQFPDQIITSDGSVIKRPTKYKIPAEYV
ncbi:MAG: NYN domain-containing protein [Alphaproteobacteria bacterium]|nr:NYN domain-containing protein [Alphaproteobacteria bacterium]